MTPHPLRLPVMPLLAKPVAVPLPPELAFVVQLQASGHQPPHTLAGRVEHIASGQAARFASLDELFAFLRHTPMTRAWPADSCRD